MGGGGFLGAMRRAMEFWPFLVLNRPAHGVTIIILLRAVGIQVSVVVGTVTAHLSLVGTHIYGWARFD